MLLQSWPVSARKPVFITGATGYVGRNVARAFRRAGWQVLGLTRDAAKASSLAAEEITPVIGTLQDPSTWRRAAESAGLLIHAAADYATDTQELDQSVTRTLVDIATARGATVIYTSGVWIHGTTGSQVADETTPLAPAENVSKRPATERIVLEAKPRGIVIRPAIVYGRQGGLTAALFTDQPVVGDGRNHWPMVHVDDVADAYVRAAERGTAGGIYILTDGATVTMAEVAAAARRAAGLSGPVKWLPLAEARKKLGAFADALVLDQRFSAARAQRELGWCAVRPGFIDEAQTYAAASGSEK